MRQTTHKSEYLAGLLSAVPFLFVVSPFSMLFGVVGTEAGLSIAEVAGFSLLVFAGAAQLTAVQLMTDEAPTVIILLTGLALNLRMAMYSASLTPWLGKASLKMRVGLAYLLVDQTYAASLARYEDKPDMALGHRIAFYIGISTPLIIFWNIFTLIGAHIGQGIPPEYALDFAMPIAFLALVVPALRTGAHIAAATVAVIMSLILAGLPFNGGLLIATALAMATGAEIERRTNRALPHDGSAP
ncbi:MAG: putative branched-subunit amino acid permease [Paracoccaceae bacterium]|jgi:predicted branched-subunit amino acid permease